MDRSKDSGLYLSEVERHWLVLDRKVVRFDLGFNKLTVGQGQKQGDLTGGYYNCPGES